MSTAPTPSTPAKGQRRSIPLDDLVQAIEDLAGFCLACGTEHDSCDPDTRGLRCEACGKPEVHGAEEIILMGYAGT